MPLATRLTRPISSAPQTHRTQTLQAIGGKLHALQATIKASQQKADLFSKLWDSAPSNTSRLTWMQSQLTKL